MMKRKNVYIGIFVITTIVASCIAVYLYLNVDKQKNEITELNAKIEELNKSNSNVEEKSSQKDSDDNIKTEYKSYKTIFNSSKCLNPRSNVEYKINIEDNFNGISCRINEDKKSVNIGINWDSVNNLYGISKPNNVQGNYSNITVSGFSSEIVDVNILGTGQAVGNEVFLFLMKDGTVEYIPVYKSLQSNDFKSYGKIDKIADVIGIAPMLSTGTSEPKISFYTIGAIKEDGSFYDLGYILEQTGKLN